MQKVLSLLLFTFFISAFGQDTLWTRRLDTGLEEIGIGVATSGEDIVVAGIRGDTTNDWLIVKYDRNGDTLWTRTYDTGIYDYAIDAAFDPQGNIIVSGLSFTFRNHEFLELNEKKSQIKKLSHSFNPFNPIRHRRNEKDQLIYALTVKYNSLGDTLWSRTQDMAFAYGAGTDDQGNVYVSGSFIDFVAGTDFWLAKYSPSGELVWTRTFDFTPEDYGYRLSVDRSNNIIMTGYSGEYPICDLMLLKFNSNGDTLWTRRVDSGNEDYGISVATDEFNNIIVAGVTGSMSNYDFLILKYDSLGNLLWTRTFDWGVDDQAFGIGCDPRNNIFVGGMTGDFGLYDYLTIGYSPAGETIMTAFYDNGSDDMLQDLAVDNAGNIIVTGGSMDTILFSYDFLTIKYLNLVGISETQKLKTQNLITLTPSIIASQRRFILNLPNSDYYSINFYDVTGRVSAKLFQGYLSQGPHNFPAPNLNSGIYFIKIESRKIGGDIYKVIVKK